MSTLACRFSGLTSGYDMFTRAIPSYDRLQEQVTIEVERGFSRWPWLLSYRCLELGGGTGVTTRALLRTNSVRITTVENDPDMLLKLHANLESCEVQKSVTVVDADILDHLINLESGLFEFVVSSFTLHNIECSKRDRIIREIFRVLAPGGKFVNADKYARDCPDEHALAFKRQIIDFEIFEMSAKTGDLEKWKAHYVRDEQPDVIFFETPAKKTMREIGFEDVTTVYRENMEAVIVGRKR